MKKKFIETDDTIMLKREFFGKNYPYIYYLIKDSKIIYIGKTKRPSDRMMNHYKKNVFNFDYIKIFICNIENIDKLEKELIEKYTPKYNKKYNPIYLNKRK